MACIHATPKNPKHMQLTCVPHMQRATRGHAPVDRAEAGIGQMAGFRCIIRATVKFPLGFIGQICLPLWVEPNLTAIGKVLGQRVFNFLGRLHGSTLGFEEDPFCVPFTGGY
jgi:hypothetical protein